MPLPKSADPGKTMKMLKKEHPNMPHKQMVAIAMKQSRQHDKKDMMMDEMKKRMK